MDSLRGRCQKCGKCAPVSYWQMVNGFYCAVCCDLLGFENVKPAPPGIGDPSWRHNNDPSFDNVVSAYEHRFDGLEDVL